MTTVAYAGREILATGGELSETEVEVSTEFSREWTPTVSGVPYPSLSGNEVTEMPFSVVKEYAEAAALLRAAAEELEFARGQASGELEISTAAPPTESAAVLELAAATSAQANVRYVHVSAGALGGAAGAPCSGIAIQGGTSDSNDRSNLTPRFLAAYSTTEGNALDATPPTLLAVSEAAAACTSGVLNRWSFPAFRLPSGGAHLRLAMLSAADATEWTPNSFPYLRAAMAAADGSLGFVSSGNNQMQTAFFPHLVISYTATTVSQAGSASFSRALLTGLSQRVTLGPRCLRLVSTWTFAVDAHTPPSVNFPS